MGNLADSPNKVSNNKPVYESYENNVGKNDENSKHDKSETLHLTTEQLGGMNLTKSFPSHSSKNLDVYPETRIFSEFSHSSQNPTQNYTQQYAQQPSQSSQSFPQETLQNKITQNQYFSTNGNNEIREKLPTFENILAAVKNNAAVESGKLFDDAILRLETWEEVHAILSKIAKHFNVELYEKFKSMIKEDNWETVNAEEEICRFAGKYGNLELFQHLLYNGNVDQRALDSEKYNLTPGATVVYNKWSNNSDVDIDSDSSSDVEGDESPFKDFSSDDDLNGSDDLNDLDSTEDIEDLII